MTKTDGTRKSPKRLIIDIPEELHGQIKSIAAMRNITIGKWVTRLIIKEINRLESFNGKE
jgi:predicted HicB family RNase H-like nuclease